MGLATPISGSMYHGEGCVEWSGSSNLQSHVRLCVFLLSLVYSTGQSAYWWLGCALYGPSGSTWVIFPVEAEETPWSPCLQSCEAHFTLNE